MKGPTKNNDPAKILFVLAVAIVLIWLAGCGGPLPTKSPENPNNVGYGGPAKLVDPPPAVVIVGDSVVNAWCSPAMLAANPSWTCQGTPAGVVQETTAEVLARFQAAIALQPQVIAIEAGVWDINDFASVETIGVNPCDTKTPNPCTNVQTMAQEAEAAGIYVVVCTIPPWGDGPAATENSDGEVDLQHGADIGYFNQAIMTAAYSKGVATDMYTPLAVNSLNDEGGTALDDATDVYNAQYTTDGVNPNAAGGQVMTAALQLAVTNSKMKGVLR